MNYLSWDEKTITDFSDENIADMYDRGYVFTRKGKGVMQQTRSVRIDLRKFNLSSENRRILKKIGDVGLQEQKLPISTYDIRLAKHAKDFYEEKFGPGIMSAQKVKEMLTSKDNLNFNLLLGYYQDKKDIGWTICYVNSEILHYSYPFYDLNVASKDMGLGMMIKAIEWAQKNPQNPNDKKKYIYLGSLQRPSDTYKLQFEGLEWFDGKEWQMDIEAVKKVLAEKIAAV